MNMQPFRICVERLRIVTFRLISFTYCIIGAGYTILIAYALSLSESVILIWYRFFIFPNDIVEIANSPVDVGSRP